MIEAVLFDIDGTLVDHESAESRAFIDWSNSQGWLESANENKLLDIWHDIAEQNLELYNLGKVDFKGQRRKRLREFLPLVGVNTVALSNEELDKIFEGYLARYEAAWGVFEDVKSALDKLKPLARLAILSNGEQEQQIQKIHRAGIRNYFEQTLTSGELGVAKPEVATFLLACEELRVEPHQTLYVGDRLQVDVLPAMEAGLSAILIDRSKKFEPIGREIQVVESLEDLDRFL